MKFVYVAGPITAYNSTGNWDSWKSEQYVRNAEAISLDLNLGGIANHCPHTQGRYWNSADRKTVNALMLADFEIIRRCDALVVCPGWRHSRGTLEEITLAKRIGIPVFYIEALTGLSIAEVIAWANG